MFTISGVDPTTGEFHPDAPTAVASTASPVVRLQNALKALGTTAGDPQLLGIQIDGVVGPKTVQATNYALLHFVGATPGFPGANLTAIQVRQSAAVLADRVEARTKKSGGVTPAPPKVTARAHSASRASAFSPIPEMPAEPDRRWVFWVVGGVGVLVLLSAATAALKKRKEAHA